MVTYTKTSPKNGEPQRYSWECRKRKTVKYNKTTYLALCDDSRAVKILSAWFYILNTDNGFHSSLVSQRNNDRQPILHDHCEENVLLHSSHQSWSIDRATGKPSLLNSNQHTEVSLSPNILGKGEMGRKRGMWLKIVTGHTHTHTHTYLTSPIP